MDAQAGLDPCWSQTHYVGFVMTRLKSFSTAIFYKILQKPTLSFI
jgi:hypothetical protein